MKNFQYLSAIVLISVFLGGTSWASQVKGFRCLELFFVKTPPINEFSATPKLDYKDLRFFTRWPDDNSTLAADSAYLLNVKESLAFFRSWLQGKVDFSPKEVIVSYGATEGTITLSPFRQVLLRMHEILSLGESGDRYYFPTSGTSGKDGRASSEPYAKRYGGKLRGQLDGQPTSNEMPVEAIEILKKLGRWKSVASFNVKINGIENFPNGTPQIQTFIGEKLYYKYPSFGYVHRYLSLMEERITSIKSLLGKQSLNKSEILMELANYYHLGVVGHLFLRGNNSLLMMNVNAVLVELGMDPIFHGVHDFVVRQLDTDDAVDYMVKVMTGSKDY